MYSTSFFPFISLSMMTDGVAYGMVLILFSTNFLFKTD